MSTTLKHKIVKVRKDTRCVACFDIVKKGEEMVYFVGITEGDFQASHFCLCCDAFIQDTFESDDTFCPGDFANEPEYEKYKSNFKSNQ